MFTMPFSLAVEITGTKYKTLIGVMFQAPFALGAMFVGGLAVWVRDWRPYQMILTAPFPVCAACCYFIAESPRWLIAKGDHDAARRVIRTAAAFNKVTTAIDLLGAFF